MTLHMFNPIQIANYLIAKSFETGNLLTPMKILKLVYLAHGWHLAVRDKSLITEIAEAWKYGPVIPSVYNAYKKFGHDFITSMVNINFPNEIDKNTANLLDKVFDTYKDRDGLQLSNLTHLANSPWDQVWNQSSSKHSQNIPIPNNIIKKYYCEMADRNRQKMAS